MCKKSLTAANFDFKLLGMFNEIYKYSSVTRAAEALNCSPAFVSKCLQKMRVYFSDPLFVRNGQKLTPTTMAETIHLQIARQYSGILNSLDALASSTTKDLLIIHCSAWFATRIIPRIVTWAEANAPGCRIVHRDAMRAQDTPEDLLLQRDVDLVFDMDPIFHSAIVTSAILDEKLSVVCRIDHPRLGSQICAAEARLEKFAVLNTRQPGLQSTQATIESQLGERLVRYSTCSVQSIPAVVAHTDTVGIIPTWLYEKSRHVYPLRELATEFELNSVRTYMIYNKVAMQNAIFARLIAWLEHNPFNP
ncbi:LysR substrate-binding domain-containing protein [Enterobacter sp.]|uniref:LysR substrate-binding domain-containing protein n=1 Tax=Enterobacter sp. TaxID=42895 RepID=UPI00296FD71D|nr:LysR substrate-binding domain-containing protein [Enterobacter sp.]